MELNNSPTDSKIRRIERKLFSTHHRNMESNPEKESKRSSKGR